jgi:hypothetical protein
MNGAVPLLHDYLIVSAQRDPGQLSLDHVDGHFDPLLREGSSRARSAGAAATPQYPPRRSLPPVVRRPASAAQDRRAAVAGGEPSERAMNRGGPGQ